MLAPLQTSAVICLYSVMESCADSNNGTRELLMFQGDAAKRDPPSDLMNLAESEVHGGGKCTQLSVVSLPGAFSLLHNDYVLSRIILFNGTDADANSVYICISHTPNNQTAFTQSTIQVLQLQ